MQVLYNVMDTTIYTLQVYWYNSRSGWSLQSDFVVVCMQFSL